jgi:FkbH-like protein
VQLRRSRFIHAAAVGEGRTLLFHAVSHLRLVVDAEVFRIVDYFQAPRTLPQDLEPLSPQGAEDGPLVACLSQLVERGVLTPLSPEAELQDLEKTLQSSFGRDPAALLERHRRQAKEGPLDYWATGAPQGLRDLAAIGRRIDLILLGDCDVHMEADFLRQEGARRGLDLHVAAAFPDDVALAEERAHDAVLIGASRARHAIAGPAAAGGEAPYAGFINEADRLLRALRARTKKPILIDNLPEPTVEPLGLAERGVLGHRNRFRLANVALSQLSLEHADVHVVDLASSFARAGAERLIDDGQVGFTHFGSPGWMLQRGEDERRAVHDLFPDTAPLAAEVGGDPYVREKIAATAHLDVLQAVIGHDRKKCVIVDLDGVLWPGVLAETGAPFAWSPEISGAFSFIGLYFGLHEALLALKRRGVLLACVSKNDEAVVRALWTYPEHYPKERLLSPEDFVTWRVNWRDKVENIVSIAEELGFAQSAFLFIDDHPVERDRVRTRLPEVETWGENLFALRRRLLTDPRLQTPQVTEEGASRTELVRAQLDRQKMQAGLSEADYLASLGVTTETRRLGPEDAFERIEELLKRTTQFNTTALSPSSGDLAGLAGEADGHVLCLKVKDRFGDHGVVGASVVKAGEILVFAMSCRVLGLGAEKALMTATLEAIAAEGRLEAAGRILETDRNLPVRNLYREAGFALGADGLWRRSLASADPLT